MQKSLGGCVHTIFRCDTVGKGMLRSERELRVGLSPQPHTTFLKGLEYPLALVSRGCGTSPQQIPREDKCPGDVTLSKKQLLT